MNEIEFMVRLAQEDMALTETEKAKIRLAAARNEMRLRRYLIEYRWLKPIAEKMFEMMREDK